MSQTQYSITCETYKNNIFKSLFSLQTDEEFVDLTIAADGCFVKVHKNIIALASPYLKKLIQLCRGQDSIIYLNNVSSNILSYLIEYMYQGEVNVPENDLASFIQVSKDLQMSGLNQLIGPKKEVLNPEVCSSMQHPSIVPEARPEIRLDNFAACITIGSDRNVEVQNYTVNDPQQKYSLDTEIEVIEVDKSNIQEQTNNIKPQYDNNKHKSLLPLISKNNVMEIDCSDANQNISSPIICPDDDFDIEEINLDIDNIFKPFPHTMTQFSLTERGCIQLIMNRYIYYAHFISKRGLKIRWRCKDYRRNNCPAFIDSLEGKLVKRKGLHKHDFHDEKICKKNRTGILFNTIEEAQEAADKLKLTFK